MIKEESTVPVVVIDVRTERELKADGKLPGSHNIPIAKIADAFELSSNDFFKKFGFEKPSKNHKNVVFTCQIGGRAKFARKLLQKQGYNYLRVYEGSFVDWTKNNGPLCSIGEQNC